MRVPSTRRRLAPAVLFVATTVAAVLLSSGLTLATPSISFVTPWGFIGEWVTIHGTGLGNTPGRVVFEPGDIEATVIAWMPDSDKVPVGSVICEVPAGAEATSTVKVIDAQGAESNTLPFWVYDRVWGYVFDGHGGPEEHSVQDAKVELKDKAADKVLQTGYTDRAGRFWLYQTMEKDKEYRITVTLESEDKNLVMKRDGTTVSWSKDFVYHSPEDMSTNPVTGRQALFPMKLDASKASEIADASTAKGDIDNLAAVWHWTSVSRIVAKEAGKDIVAPVTIKPYDDSLKPSDYYTWADDTIHITTASMDGGGTKPPAWQFQKNRETHEFGHALMDRLVGGPAAAASDANHSGYVNDNTGDSVTEGFAEYWATYVDEVAGITGKPQTYDGFGDLDALGGYVAWTPLDTDNPMDPPLRQSDEEFASAALMRSVSAALGGGSSGFKRVADALEKGKTLTDLRNRLVAGGASASTVDPLYYYYGFFKDLDGDWTHDPGEPVGAGNNVECLMIGSVETTVGLRPDRENRPFRTNDFVGVHLSGITSDTAESTVTVTVTHPAKPGADYSYDRLMVGADALVHLRLEPGAQAHVTARYPDGRVSRDALDITWDQWSVAQSLIESGAALATSFANNGVAVAGIAGTSRYGTAIECSKRAFPGGASAVIIATGTNFPDALGAAGLAGVVRAPILLHPYSSSLDTSVMLEMLRLFGGNASGKRIYILGRTPSVTAGTEAQLRLVFAAATFTRLGGADRYDTARRIAREARARSAGPLTKAVVVSGTTFPDAMLAGPLAYAQKRPILLVNPAATVADVNLRSALTYCGVKDIDVVGSTSAVSKGMLTSLDASYGTVKRVASSTDRYAQAVTVANWATGQGLTWSGAGIATGEDFPDSLAAGPVLGEAKYPLLITPKATLNTGVGAALTSHKTQVGTIEFFGGPTSVTPAVRGAAMKALE